jgi:hypothetical protein
MKYERRKILKKERDDLQRRLYLVENGDAPFQALCGVLPPPDVKGITVDKRVRRWNPMDEKWEHLEL